MLTASQIARAEWAVALSQNTFYEKGWETGTLFSTTATFFCPSSCVVRSENDG